MGESGKGKTTVAQLSVETGHIALGDDLNFIIQVRPNDYKLGVAPSIVPTLSSYSMLNPSLRGIFKLTKDNHDELIQLSPRNIAKNLLESLKQIPKAASLSDQIFQNAFQTISSIARAVPGYELHFRKSPDFWKLIDERFPD